MKSSKVLAKKIPVRDHSRVHALSYGSDHEDRWARVATAAYYKSESRGFKSGHDLEDWLAAEKDVT